MARRRRALCDSMARGVREETKIDRNGKGMWDGTSTAVEIEHWQNIQSGSRTPRTERLTSVVEGIKDGCIKLQFRRDVGEKGAKFDWNKPSPPIGTSPRAGTRKLPEAGWLGVQLNGDPTIWSIPSANVLSALVIERHAAPSPQL